MLRGMQGWTGRRRARGRLAAGRAAPAESEHLLIIRRRSGSPHEEACLVWGGAASSLRPGGPSGRQKQAAPGPSKRLLQVPQWQASSPPSRHTRAWARPAPASPGRRQTGRPCRRPSPCLGSICPSRISAHPSGCWSCSEQGGGPGARRWDSRAGEVALSRTLPPPQPPSGSRWPPPQQREGLPALPPHPPRRPATAVPCGTLPQATLPHGGSAGSTPSQHTRSSPRSHLPGQQQPPA
jgi:hypothetical protein